MISLGAAPEPQSPSCLNPPEPAREGRRDQKGITRLQHEVGGGNSAGTSTHSVAGTERVWIRRRPEPHQADCSSAPTPGASRGSSAARESSGVERRRHSGLSRRSNGHAAPLRDDPSARVRAPHAARHEKRPPLKGRHGRLLLATVCRSATAGGRAERRPLFRIGRRAADSAAPSICAAREGISGSRRRRSPRTYFRRTPGSRADAGRVPLPL